MSVNLKRGSLSFLGKRFSVIGWFSLLEAMMYTHNFTRTGCMDSSLLSTKLNASELHAHSR